jgi:hypothetical protein
MNVLIFVMTILMLLSLMTYARLDTYFGSEIFQVLFKNYMEEYERGYINDRAVKLYHLLKVSEKKGSSSPTKAAATPQLSLILLKDKKQRESKQGEWQQRVILLKRLMSTLYENQPFFKRLMEENSSFLDELVAQLTQAIDALPEEKAPKKIIDLALVTLADPKLDAAFYKMLHGALSIKESEEAEAADAEEKDEGKLIEDGSECESPAGYYSLIDFIDFSPNSKIRIYLASREVLSSIFLDPAVVEEIIRVRNSLYKEAKANAETKELEERFKGQFDARRDPAIDSGLLDYSVTKTNPKSYE